MSNRTDRALDELYGAGLTWSRHVVNSNGITTRIEFTNGTRRLVVKPGKGVYVYNPKSKRGLTKHSKSGNAWYVSSEQALAREIRYIVHT